VRTVLVDDGYEVVGVVASADDVELAVGHHDPDVVVLDLVLADGDGLQVADDLRVAGRAAPVILFSSLFDRRIARETMASRYGYVEKADAIEGLVLAIEGAIDLAAANRVPDGVVIDLRDQPVNRVADG